MNRVEKTFTVYSNQLSKGFFLLKKKMEEYAVIDFFRLRSNTAAQRSNEKSTNLTGMVAIMKPYIC